MSDQRAARELMDHFAAATSPADGAERRYLWTDAFAVCNWIGLGEVDRARTLADRVHHVLGRHRQDDPRDGWISGLPEDEGARHPTAGGLRIGKPLPERREDQAYHPQLEWERDGQYFHYLTRWMRALLRLAAATSDPRYHAWAAELARVAFDRFSHGIGPAPNRLHWKMSIDLSRPQVPSMGQHDPLDGYVVMREIRMARFAGITDVSGMTDVSDLDSRMDLLAGMGEGSDLATEDPLGAGSLLTDAWFLARSGDLDPGAARILERVVRAAGLSLREVRSTRTLDLPADRRLAFRELGLAIGLAALERLAGSAAPVWAAGVDGGRAGGAHLEELLEELLESLPLRAVITRFWMDPDHRRVAGWREHADINTVMLATAVHPAGYLDAWPHF